MLLQRGCRPIGHWGTEADPESAVRMGPGFQSVVLFLGGRVAGARLPGHIPALGSV